MGITVYVFHIVYSHSLLKMMITLETSAKAEAHVSVSIITFLPLHFHCSYLDLYFSFRSTRFKRVKVCDFNTAAPTKLSLVRVKL